MGQSDMKKIPFLLFYSAPFGRRAFFIIDDQSRIASVCREIT
jgi:hypothetical protein